MDQAPAPNPPPAPEPQRRRTWIASAVLVAVAVVGTALLAGVIVVRGVVLDAGTYRGALVEADAYERTYTEVFADPEMAALKEQLIGRVVPEVAGKPTQVRALATAALRWTVPPSTLQRGAETVIDRTIAYVRGDVPRLDGDVDVGDVLSRIETTAVTEVRSALALSVENAAASIGAYRAAVSELADEIAAGRVPASIPVLGGSTFDPEVVVDAILDELGPLADDELRARVDAAVRSGAEREALIDAAGVLVRDHADAVSSSLRELAEDGREVDVLAEIAERAGRPVDEIVAALDDARDAARWFHPLVGVLGAVLVVLAVVGLLRVHRAEPRRAGFLVALAAGVSAGALALAWLAVAAALTDPLALAADDDGWRLPPGLRNVLGDVRDAVAADVAGTLWRIVLVLILTGATIAGALVLANRGRDLRPARDLVVALGAGAVVALVTAVLVSGDSTSEPIACNGHPELCERRYDEVVYAGTHNAMSSPDVVFIWPEHDGNLRAQLDAGVRALLIDAKYWTTAESAQRFVDAEPLLPSAVAQSAFVALGDRTTGREGTFLCHIHCAFGEIDFVESMVTVRRFLEANPGEVVTLIIQDEVDVADIEAGVLEAGLAPFLHAHEPGTRWATLGELVERGERLVVLAENQGPPPHWFHQGFELMQETPFLFREPEAMSCVPNRGAEDASLFQLNHWVQRVAPDRVDAVVVNSHDFLVERARRCQDERGLLPNFVAVNFYNIGDLVAAVDTLNGVG